MRLRILKECRALAPMWVAALAMVVGPLLVWPVTRDAGIVMGIAMFGFAASVAFLSVASFGKEFALGTYGLLLAQPVSRWRLWWEKTLVLGAALASVVVVFLAGGLAYLPGVNPSEGLSAGRFALIAILTAGAAYSGGLCLTLLLRQANGAFWLAILFPIAACLVAVWFAGKLWGEAVETLPILVVALGGYSLIAYALGLRLFLKQEDTAWLGGDVTFRLAPSWLVQPASEAKPGRRFGALTALLVKELHLQQVNLFCGALLALLFASVALVRESELKVLDIPLHQFLTGILVLIWVTMPFLIGAVAIAEERRLGLLEWQQSLPASRWRQFLTKWISACCLSVLLAAVLPWLLDALAWFIAGEGVTGMMNKLHEAKDGKGLALALWVTLCLPALASILATTIGLFASSLVRNLLHAVSLIFVMFVAAWGLVGLFLLAYESHRSEANPIGLLALIALPLLLVVSAGLAYRNYREAVPGASLWRTNLIALGILCVCVFGITAALHARAWELLIPEPRISSAPVNGPALPKITSLHTPSFILLPDGNLWEWLPDEELLGQPTRIGSPGEWRDVASRALTGGRYTNETVALKADGTLWRWLYYLTTNSPDPGFRRQTDPAQVGTDHDWKAIEGGGNHLLALKSDGTLWAWGRNDKGQLGDGTTLNRDEPVRIGSDTNWAQATAGSGTSLALKSDGSLWEWGIVPLQGNPLQPGRQEQPVCPLPRQVGTGTNWAHAALSGSGRSLAIKTDGTLWKWGDSGRGVVGVSMPSIREPARIGTDSDWMDAKAAEFGNFHTLGLKQDGSLWMAKSQDLGGPEWMTSGKSLFSRRSNQKPWLAVGFNWSADMAVASDGSLWIWDYRYEYGQGSGMGLIPPSQRPHRFALETASSTR